MSLLAPVHANGLTPHAPIDILGNAGFTAANGVVRGNGSAESPFEISGWDIDAPEGIDAIHVQVVTASFVIKNNWVHHASPHSDDGITLEGAGSRGVVSCNVIEHNFRGILMDETVATIFGNRIEENAGGGGLWATSPTPLAWSGVRNNTFLSNTPWAIFHSENVLQPSEALPIDASNNYWGGPLPPTTAVFAGAFIIPLGIPGDNYVAPTVVTVPVLLDDQACA